MEKRRVVVTGIGLVTPLGCQVSTIWSRLCEGKSGISSITHFDASSMASRVAGEIPQEDGENGLHIDEYIAPKDQKKMDRFLHLGVIAAEKALKDSGWRAGSHEDQCRTGVLIGSGIGGLSTIENNSVLCHEEGARRISPFFIVSSLINLLSGQVSIAHGFKGPNVSIVTACSSGAHSIGEAVRMILCNDADVMVAGGSEASICPIGIGGFAAMRALSTQYNDKPQEASRPWDKNRDGFVMGEGAGVMVLEELSHAKRRGAQIYGEIVGYGLSGDANHITMPAADGDGAYRCMKMALAKAGISPEEVGYINAHGTSTPLGDTAELRAVERLFPNLPVMMSSTKSSMGHLLGASGSVEAILSLLSLKTGDIPPTLNLHEPEETFLDLVALSSRYVSNLTYVLTNSFGFGGTNSSIIFKKWTE